MTDELHRRAFAPGHSLVELLIAVLISSLIALVGVPPMMRWASGLSVRLAAAEVATSLQRTRQYAVRHNRNVALKFQVAEDGSVSFAIFRDGDHDGVLNRDIAAGIDPQVTPARPLSYLGGGVRFGFPPGPPPLAPGPSRKPLDRLDDPIRFNRSDLASFSRTGTATPGTVYLTDGRHHLMAVRVANRSGKISVLSYDPVTRRWR